MLKKFVVFLLLSLVLGCGKSDTASIHSVNLKVKDCFSKLPDKVKICLDSVYNDSRCPNGIQCIWEGDALADFTMTSAKTTNRFTLHSNTKFQNDTIIEGISIKLIQINPYPTVDNEIDPEFYTVEVSITSN